MSVAVCENVNLSCKCEFYMNDLWGLTLGSCWCSYLTSILSVPQIAGFINGIHPFYSDNENLTAFRFYAMNPIVDPWVFIICRKSVFRHLYSLLSCRFSRGAVKTTAHCALSLPLDNVIQRNPPEVTVPQNNMYSGLPLWPLYIPICGGWDFPIRTKNNGGKKVQKTKSICHNRNLLCDNYSCLDGKTWLHYRS